MATATTDATPARPNRSLTVLGSLLILGAVVAAWWFATFRGDFVTGMWMVLFVVSGVVLISIGRHPGAE